MKILFCGYREWSKRVYTSLKTLHEIEFCESQSELNNLDPTSYKMVFFVGWSDIINNYWINTTECICLHPSLLPKYRGGSPIQNQIIAGEKWSGVTLFKMNEKVDSGDIIRQTKFSLSGSLSSIFSRIEVLATSLIDDIITTEKLSYRKQKEEDATYYKRRTPSMSEIKISDFKNFTAEEIYNKIRCLQAPYPLPYLLCKDDTKLYITGASV